MAAAAELRVEQSANEATGWSGKIGIGIDDYTALCDQLLMANRLFEERESLSRSANRALRVEKETAKEEIARLVQQNEKLKRALKTLRSERSAERVLFGEDLAQLTNAADLIERREREVEDKLKSVESALERRERDKDDELKTMTKHADDLRSQLERAKQELGHLKKLIETEEIVPVDVLKRYKSRVDETMIEKEVYVGLLGKYEKLRTTLERDTVPVEEFTKLKYILQEITEEKRLVDETTRFLDEEKHSHLLAAKEAESRSDLLKEKINSLEIELQKSSIQQDSLQQSVAHLSKVLQDSDEERRAMSNRIVNLEIEKASMLTQLGISKISYRKREESEKEVETLKQEIAILRDSDRESSRRVDQLKSELKILDGERMATFTQLRQAEEALKMSVTTSEEALKREENNKMVLENKLSEALKEIEEFSYAVLEAQGDQLFAVDDERESCHLLASTEGQREGL